MEPLVNTGFFVDRTSTNGFNGWRFNPQALVNMIRKLVPSHPLNDKRLDNNPPIDYIECLEAAKMI